MLTDERRKCAGAWIPAVPGGDQLLTCGLACHISGYCSQLGSEIPDERSLLSVCTDVPFKETSKYF